MIDRRPRRSPLARLQSRAGAARTAFLEPLERRELLATITWDGGGDGTTLTEAANWTGDVAPGPADDAVINVGATPTITLSSGSFSVLSLTCAETFTMSGGTLTLAAASAFSGAFTITSGTITGAGDIDVTTSMTWTNGTISGAGSLTIDAAATLLINGSATGLLRELVNDGTATWSAGFIGGFGGTGGTITNNGTFTANGTASSFSNNTTPSSFINHGAFTKAAATTLTFNSEFTSDGTVTVSAGTLSLDGGGTNTGSVTVSGGATLRHQSGTFEYDAGTTLGGTGSWSFAGATVSFDTAFSPGGAAALSGGTLTLSAAAQTIGTFTITSGTLDGGGDVNITTAMTWTNGTLAGTGVLTIDATATLAINGSAAGLLREVVNDGTATWSSGFIGSFSGVGGTFTNNGSFTANGTASSFNNNTSPSIFVNRGTFTKAGAGTVTFNSEFTSEGGVTVSAGILSLDGGGSNTGSVTVSAGTLRHGNGNFDYDTGTTFAGSGAWSFTGASVSFGVAFSPAGAVSLSSGTVTLNAASQTLATFTITSGTLTGPGDVDIATSMTWTNGTISGTGVLTIGAAATLAINGSATGLLREVVNDGATTWSAGFIGSFSGTGGTFTNNGTFTASGTASSFNNNTTASAFVNHGTFTKSGSGTITFNSEFSSDGAVSVAGGTLSLDAGGTSTGSVSVAATTTLRHGGGTMDYDTGTTLAGTGAWSFTGASVAFDIAFSPSGLVAISGGTVTLNAASQTFATFTITSGTLTGAGDVDIATSMTWTNGSVAGTGVLTIDAGATLAINGSATGLLRDVVNDGTTTWSSGFIGSFTGNGATFTNNNLFTVSGSASSFNSNSSPSAFVNNGTFNKNGATTVTFNVAFTTGSDVNVNAGTLALAGGGGLGGTVTLAGSTFLDMTAGTFADTTGTITGLGTTRFQGGTHGVTGTLTVETLTSIDSTTITGTGNLVLDGTTDWNSGTMSGSGTTTVGAGVTLTMATGSTKGLGRTLVNNGAINHSAGALQFLGSGTLVNSAARRYTASGTAQIIATGSGNVINNAGIFSKEGSGTLIVQPEFNNLGALNLVGGILNIDGGGTNSGARNILSGTTLNYRDNYTHAAGSTLAGSGSVNFDGGNQTISGNWTANTFLKLVSGTLDGPGTITTTGPFFWLAGTMSGSGTTAVAGNGKLAISTFGSHTLSRSIVNDGVLHYLNGTLTLLGATITNNAGRIFAMLPSATLSVSGGTNVINNAGILRKMGPDTITLDSTLGGVRLNNTGAVDIRNGVLNLNGPVTQVSGNTLTAGTWQVFPAGTLGLGSTVIRTLGAAATVSMVGGNASFTAISGLNTNNGTILLTLGGAFTITPASGTLTNNGTIDLARSRALNVAGNFVQGAGGILNLDIQGFGTSLFSRVAVSGSATLAGTVTFDFIGGFDPASGSVFSFFTAGSRNGQFTTASIPPLAGRVGSLQYHATGVRLVIT